MRLLLLLILVLPQVSFSQNERLELFDNLVNKNWAAEGKWGDGTPFKQEVTFQYGLDSNIVIVNSKGFTDKERKNFGARNHGVRKFDKTANEIKFWEFDVFGGLTKGIVKSDGKNILYTYQYGESLVTDMWEYKDDTTYFFKVGNFEEGQWKQVYLSAQFQEKKPSEKEQIFSSLKNSLLGKWSSKAWDGELIEIWETDENNHLVQTAKYSENEIILYEATNKIEVVNDDLILFTVIKGNNPKIFKATSYSENQIIFENSDYKNPNKVIYDFSKEKEFQRTISGIENEETVTYTFDFQKMK